MLKMANQISFDLIHTNAKKFWQQIQELVLANSDTLQQKYKIMCNNLKVFNNVYLYCILSI